MKILEKLIGDSTYMVVDNPSNRFNFCGLIEVTPELAEMGKQAIVWTLTKDLPEDLQRAIDVMAENDVIIEDFTGIITFDRDNDTYYLLIYSEL
jgi:hypothetical protein